MRNNSPLIDSHIHIYHASGFERMLDVARQAGLDAFAFQSISQYDRQHMAQNAMGLALKGGNPDKVYFFAGLHHYLPGATAADLDLAEQARRMVACGCDGFKLLETKPNCYKRVGKRLDGPEFAPFFEYVESTGLPITWHVVDPDVCWDAARCPKWFVDSGYFYDSSFPTERELRDQVETVLRRHPKLKVTFAHFYFLSQDIAEARRFLAEFPGANLDITPGDEMYINFSRDVAAWRQFFIDHQDRIILGTDNCDTQATAQMGELSTGASNVRRILQFLEASDTIRSFSGGDAHGLSLPPQVVAKIAGGNFVRMAGRGMAVPAMCDTGVSPVRDAARTGACREDAPSALLEDEKTKKQRRNDKDAGETPATHAPRPLDLPKCREYCQWLLPFAKRSDLWPEIWPDLQAAMVFFKE